MVKSEDTFATFCRRIGVRAVRIECGADLDHEAEELLDAVSAYHRGGGTLAAGIVIDHKGIPFILSDLDGTLVVHGPDVAVKGLPDTLSGTDQCLRILYEQEAVAQRVGAEPRHAPLLAAVTFDSRALRQVRACLYRIATDAPSDSGWRIVPVSHDHNDPIADTLTTTIAEVHRVRRWFGKVLALPPGSRVLVGSDIESVKTANGCDAWFADPAILARLAHAALNEGRLSDLERIANSLLESTTTDIVSFRAIRRLARRRHCGPWSAYANALTALARQKADKDAAAQTGLLVAEFQNALSAGGKLSGESAPVAITENVITLYRAYAREEAAEVLEGLLVPASNQQASLLFLRAVFAIDAQNYKRAVEALRHAVTLEPNSASLWHFLGHVVLHEAWCERMGSDVRARLDEVIDACDHVFRIADTSKLTLPVDDVVRAIAHRELRCEWTIADIISDRTVALRERGRLEEALISARRLVSVDPDKPQSWTLLATVLTALGQHPQAITAYTEAIERTTTPHSEDPEVVQFATASPWYERAALHAHLGHRDAAIADLRQALAMAPAWAASVLGDDRFRQFKADNELQRVVAEARGPNK